MLTTTPLTIFFYAFHFFLKMPPSPLSLRRGSIALRSSELDMDSTMVWTSSPSSFSPLADHRFSDASVLNQASIIQQPFEPVGTEPRTPGLVVDFIHFKFACIHFLDVNVYGYFLLPVFDISYFLFFGFFPFLLY